MLNITNPMTCLTRAVCRESPLKAVGLCHEVGNWCLDLAIALGKPAEAIRPVGRRGQPPSGGDRTGRRRRGRVRRPLRHGRGSRRPARRSRPARTVRSPRRSRASTSSSDTFSPSPCSTASARCQPPATATSRSSCRGSSPRSRDGDRRTTSTSPPSPGDRSTRSATSPTSTPGSRGASSSRPGNRESCRARSSTRWSPGTARELPVNIPNDGQVPDVDDEVVVESICVVDDKGVRGRDRARLPRPFAELLRRHVAVQEMTVEAALGRRSQPGDRRVPPRSAGGSGRPRRNRGDGRRAVVGDDAMAAAVRPLSSSANRRG